MQEKLKQTIAESIAVKQRLLESDEFLTVLTQVIARTVDVFSTGGKALFCGNGGSAADAQHIAAELSGRFYLDRPPLFAEALHVNTSYLTAAANDFGYDAVYGRLVRAMGKPGDLLFALSTSGNSPNVLGAIEAAREKQMVVVGLTGQSGGKMAALCDFLLAVPSTDTPRIQEAHILIGHLLCEQVETALFRQPDETPAPTSEPPAAEGYLDWL